MTLALEPLKMDFSGSKMHVSFSSYWSSGSYLEASPSRSASSKHPSTINKSSRDSPYTECSSCRRQPHLSARVWRMARRDTNLIIGTKLPTNVSRRMLVGLRLHPSPHLVNVLQLIAGAPGGGFSTLTLRDAPREEAPCEGEDFL